jgi:hypothetical protein
MIFAVTEREKTMTELEAKAILNSYGAPVNIAKHIEAINVAIRALGGKATMAEIWAWAKQPAELEVENGKT